MSISGIQRFIDAQKESYSGAFLEIKQGYKRSHWMWYVFPQIHGLGESQTSKYFAIKSIDEAREYLKNQYLYDNLINICEELLKQETNDPVEIFGEIDAMKLRSSMTLFNYVCNLDKNKIDVFEKVLIKYFNGQNDTKTLDILLNEN